MNKTSHRIATLLVVFLFATGLLAGPVTAASKPAVRKQARESKDIKVQLYMTSWCPYCKQARAHLESLGVTLVEYDIEEDAARLKEMKKLSGGSTMVPLINIEGIVVRGFAPEEIDEAVAARKKSRK